MKIAIPIWSELVSPVFDSAQKLLIIFSEGRTEKSRELIHLPESSLTTRVTKIATLEISDVICGAISRPLADLLVSSGIVLHPWISGRVDDVVSAFLNGKLDGNTFSMPGCKKFYGGCQERRNENSRAFLKKEKHAAKENRKRKFYSRF